MSNYVKVSSVGHPSYHLDESRSLDQNVDEMIKHLNLCIEPVLPDKPDLIVLPEACDRPPNFSMERRLAYYEARGERILNHFKDMAQKQKCNIAYSAARSVSDGTYKNSTWFINRKGGIDGIYDKNHLVISEFTEGNIFYGKDAPVIQTDFGKVAGVICFDLNFEELRKKYEAAKPDLLVFSSMYHGGLMQNYWAYSCRSYFVSSLPGLPSSVLSPLGTEIASSTNYFNHVTATVNLDYKVAHLDENWQKLREAKKKYGPKINIFDPGFLGAVLITSESAELTAQNVANEFQIELIDDYFKRSTEMRHIPGNMR